MMHGLPTDTSSGCFNDLLQCLLCGGTVSTRSCIATPTRHSTSVSRTFGDLVQNDDQVVEVGSLLSESRDEVQLPIVARLMGLETPVDMSWKPKTINDSFNRSRSVNYVDYLFRSNSPEPGSGLLHRRVKTCLSFREGDILVLCLEKSSNSVTKRDQKRAKDPRADQSEAKTECRKKDKGKTRTEESVISRSNACTKSETRRRLEHTKHLRLEQADMQKAGPSCRRTVNNRTARSVWQEKNDYYRKPQAMKSQSRSKGTQKYLNIPSKSKLKKQKEVNSHQSSVPVRMCSSATQRHGIKARSGNAKPRTEERRSRKGRNADQGIETFGELMMIEKMKSMIEQDLEMGRWNWDNEAGFLYREYLSMVIELGILDELVNQIVLDLAFKCDE